MKTNGLKLIVTVTGLVFTLAAGKALAADAGNKGSLSDKDFKFATDAAQGGMAEVQLGELAKTKGTSEAVRNFGDQMVRDHTKANEELRALVTKKGGMLPAQVAQKDQSTMEHLQKETGHDFDRAYLDHMVKDHKKDVKEFRDAAKDLKDPD